MWLAHGDAQVVAAAVVGTVSVARLTRLATHDTFPPALWLRLRWLSATEGRGGWREGWARLADCPFCMAPWLAIPILLWAVLAWPSGGWITAWWLVNGWLAGSYLASMIVLRDEPPEE